jgi:hypothetical protein
MSFCGYETGLDFLRALFFLTMVKPIALGSTKLFVVVPETSAATR